MFLRKVYSLGQSFISIAQKVLELKETFLHLLYVWRVKQPLTVFAKHCTLMFDRVLNTRGLLLFTAICPWNSILIRGFQKYETESRRCTELSLLNRNMLRSNVTKFISEIVSGFLGFFCFFLQCPLKVKEAATGGVL